MKFIELVECISTFSIILVKGKKFWQIITYFARQNMILALQKSSNAIVVAMEDPEDLVAIDSLKRLTNLNPDILVSGPDLLEKSLDMHLQLQCYSPLPLLDSPATIFGYHPNRNINSILLDHSLRIDLSSAMYFSCCSRLTG